MEGSERQKYLQLVTGKLVSLTAASMFILVIIFYVVELADLKRTYPDKWWNFRYCANAYVSIGNS